MNQRSTAIRLVILSILIVDIALAQSALACLPKPLNLISWWTGNANSSDLIYGNDGALHGGAGYTLGYVSDAFILPSSQGSYVSVPNNHSLNVATITITAWVRPSTYPNAYPTIVRRDTESKASVQYNLSLTSAGSASFNFGNASAILNGGNVPLGIWSHVACTYDRHVARLYVNGAVVDTALASTPIASSALPLGIGGQVSGTTRYFDGAIDEILLFGRALTPEEVIAIYNAGQEGLCLPPPCETTVFLTVDVDKDSLMCVETPSGHVMGLAGIPWNMSFVDLAISDNTVYMLDSHYNEYVDLVAMSWDKRDVVPISTNRVTINGVPVTHAEGLAWLATGLIAAVRTGDNPSVSNSLGYLALSGEVTGSYSYMQIDVTADCDGLTEDVNGNLLWWDTNPDLEIYRLASVVPPPSAEYHVIGLHGPYIAVNDIALTPGGELWGIDQYETLLRQIDPVSGAVIRSVRHTSPNPLQGLALVGPGTISGIADISRRDEDNPGIVIWPNPASKGVYFKWISRSGRHTVDIYDVRGRRVWTGMSTTQGQTYWDGRATNGTMVGSGAYFARIRDGGQELVQRVMVVR